MGTAGEDLSSPCGPIRSVSLHFTARARHFGQDRTPRPLATTAPKASWGMRRISFGKVHQ